MFQSEQKDNESGLTYLRARYYDPTIGRFTSQDPLSGALANPASQNGYNYANNDPVDMNDPDGRWGTLIQISGRGGAGAIATGAVSVGFTSNGDIGVVFTGGGGATTGVSVGIDAGLSYTNAQQFADLGGTDLSVGATGGIFGEGSVDYSASTSGNKFTNQVTGSPGLGANASLTGPDAVNFGLQQNKAYSFNVFGAIKKLVSISIRKFNAVGNR
jgi:RHS repeat-associated protein